MEGHDFILSSRTQLLRITESTLQILRVINVSLCGFKKKLRVNYVLVLIFEKIEITRLQCTPFTSLFIQFYLK